MEAVAVNEEPLTKPMDLCMIGAIAYAMLSKKKDHQPFAISLRDIDKALNDKLKPDSATLLPQEYHDYLNVFSYADSKQLAPHRPYDYDIPLRSGKEPPVLSLRKYSQDELRIVKKYLEDSLLQGWVRANRFPAVAPVLLVRKPGGVVRYCVDY